WFCSFRTKLAAALARCRIRRDALSIEYVLPETVRKQEQRASALPLCAWINTFKISLQDVIQDLKKKGFTRVETVSDFDRYTYCTDQHCHDVLLFPSSLKEELLKLDLFADCKLLLQDKSRSLAVHSGRALLSPGDDTIVAHVGSHLTVAHLSVLTNDSTATVFVCGVRSLAKIGELRDSFSLMGCQNIELLHEDFTELEPTDPRLQKAKVILLLPQCSGLGIGSPIDFIVEEHGDAGLLRDLFQGSVSEDKLRVLAERQLAELMHAMKFNKVEAIVYCTCSVYPEENELVVEKALESGVEGSKVQPYRLIPPVFSTCSSTKASSEMFFKVEPSEISSGCFLAILAREKKSSENVSVKDILARAAAKELLDGVVEEKSKEEGKKQLKIQQRPQKTAGGGREPKIAEFLHRHAVPTVKAEVSLSKAGNRQQDGKRTSGSVQLTKSLNLISATALPAAPKHRPRAPPAGTARQGETRARKARAERERLVLKPVEIVLPPPYPILQGNKPRIP
ncbi:Putative methyltransferase NSUN7, partial [Eurypyga helias]